MDFTIVQDRKVSNEVVSMRWCPNMDLLAVCFSDNRVAIHRLSWQILLEISIPSEDDTSRWITSLAWRPDGKLIGIACCDGHIELYNVETKEKVLSNKHHDFAISVLEWFECNSIDDSTAAFMTSNIDAISLSHSDRTNRFFDNLPPIPSESTHAFGQSPRPHASEAELLRGRQKCMDILASADTTGLLTMYAYGVIPLITINLSELAGGGVRPARALSMATDWSHILASVSHSHDPNSVELLCLQVDLLSCRRHEIALMTHHRLEIDHVLR
jgi:WD40 repeat protein